MDNKEKIDFSPGSSARMIISQEFKLSKWEPFRNWFFQNYSSKDKKEIQ